MQSFVSPNQYTLKKAFSCCGTGLHTGRTVNLCIKPAAENSGIRFIRTDLSPARVIPAHMDRIVDTRLATTIGDGQVTISTTEHLMAALHAFGIDNADIEIDSHEVPIMDGSAGPFLKHLRNVGKRKQNAYKKVLRITKPIRYESGDKTIEITPYDGYKVTNEISFDAEIIKTQRFTMDVTAENFINEVSDARTFGYVEQVEELWAHGLALGGTLANTIAIHWNRSSVLNEDGLRYDDEFIRHKVLDLVGDLSLLGCPIMGHITAYKTGHTEHRFFMEAIANSPECWEICELCPEASDCVITKAIDATFAAAEEAFLPFIKPESAKVVATA